MVTVQLTRSGGLLGKPLQATRRVDIPEKEIINELKSAVPVENKMARDNFHYSITINGVHTYPVDVMMLQGKLREIVENLEDNLSYG